MADVDVGDNSFLSHQEYPKVWDCNKFNEVKPSKLTQFDEAPWEHTAVVGTRKVRKMRT